MGSAGGGGGGGSGGAAGVSSLASIGLSAYGSILQGEGTAAADTMKASQLTTAAEFGKTQATLGDTVYREKLNQTLSHLDAMQASGNVDPTSPTSDSMKQYATMVSDRQRMAFDISEREQAAMDTASANYLTQSASFAQQMGVFNAVTGIVGGLGKAAVLA